VIEPLPIRLGRAACGELAIGRQQVREPERAIDVRAVEPGEPLALQPD